MTRRNFMKLFGITAVATQIDIKQARSLTTRAREIYISSNRAWIRFDGEGLKIDGYNANVEKIGTGEYSISFEVPFDNVPVVQTNTVSLIEEVSNKKLKITTFQERKIIDIFVMSKTS